MEKLPAPPTPLPVKPIYRRLPARHRLWRIYFRGGAYPIAWDAFRHVGPTTSRFDHHTRPKRVQTRGILYATDGPDAIGTALAEVFQTTAHIDRHANRPWLVAFELGANVALLDTTGRWPVRAGGNMAINSGSRPRAREWSLAIYRQYSKVEGIAYASSLTNGPCLALYERAKHAMPTAPVLNRPLSDPALFPGLTKIAATLNFTIK